MNIRKDITDQPASHDPLNKQLEFIQYQIAECYATLLTQKELIEQQQKDIKSLAGDLSPDFYNNIRKLIQEETSKKPVWYEDPPGSSVKPTQMKLFPPLAPYGVTDKAKPQEWQYKDMSYKAITYKD